MTKGQKASKLDRLPVIYKVDLILTVKKYKDDKKQIQSG